MAIDVFDENNLRGLPDNERFAKCEHILENDPDESKRWDAVWLVGELAEGLNEDDPLFNKVADLMEWVLKNDINGIVKHEASFQVAARNMREKIPALIETALTDQNIISKHEAIESLGLMRAIEAESFIKKALDDPNDEVRETATFVLKRLERLKAQGEYKPYQVL